MANADTPMGLVPIGTLNGAAFNGRVNRYFIPDTDTTSAYYIGTLVKPAGSADAEGVMTVTGITTTGDATLGPIVAVEPITRESTIYRANSTARYVWVADDPDTLFMVQDDAASTPTAAIVGNAADLTGLASGSTATGRSSTEISMASVTDSGDGTEDVIIVGLVRTPDNVIGDNAKWAVRLNNHFFTDASAGA